MDLQAKEGMDKMNSRDLSETSVIKAELQITIEMVKKINQIRKFQWSLSRRKSKALEN